MTTHEKQLAQTHDDVLEKIADALDISQSQYEEAESRYKALGDWLDRNESTLSRYEPAISLQGSFLLGTVIRPLNDADEYDIDLVCLLKASKREFTQKSLKEAVGYEVEGYVNAQNMKNPLEENQYCWTLHYAESTRFHMDVLPALPDAQRYQRKLQQLGYSSLAKDSALSGQSIAITDNTLPQYAYPTEDWPQSNPMGYAAWFRNRMIIQLTEQKRAFARRQETTAGIDETIITASVDEIPDYKVKTPLQRAVQLLKRHRDSMFAVDGEHKPSSIIITTLAGHSYNEEPTIAGALTSILRNMEQHIDYRGDEVWIENPVDPAENLADKWSKEPKKHRNFYDWLKKARRDFASYLRAQRFDAMPQVLQEGLGTDIVARTLKAIAPSPSGRDNVHRAEAAINKIRRTGTQSRPWARG